MPAESVSIACPVCGGKKSRSVVRIADAPVFCNFLHPSREEARSAARGTIELVFCLHCGHLYNAAFDQNLIHYRPGYENALHYSGRYRLYAEEEAQRLLSRYALAGRLVADIGCGDGAFLELLRQKGQCEGIGFDPSSGASAKITRAGGKIRIIPDTFSSRFAEIGADLYVARHVLEHLAEPRAFLKTLRAAMASGRPLLFLEVPDGSTLLAQCSLWDIIYEHVSCFTAHSLAYLLHLSGFSPDPPRSVFSGQYLSVDAFVAHPSAGPGIEQLQAGIAETARLAERFPACSRARKKRIEKLLRKMQADGQRALVWGAGSKGIAFLNSLPEGVDIPFIIDINPGKLGKFVPGSGQQVMGPEVLADYQPDTVFIANDIYREEIRARLDTLKVSARLHSI